MNNSLKTSKLKMILQRHSVFFTFCFLAVLIPLIPLYPAKLFLNGDYVDVHWMSRYFVEYFRAHHEIPMVYNTHLITGLIWPIFYGFLLLPLFAIIGFFLDTDHAIRVVYIFAFTAQFLSALALTYRLTKNRYLAFALASFSIWTIYPLTNLYARGAVGEFIATSLLFSGVCAWFSFLLAKEKKEQIGFGLLLGLFCATGLGSHAITLFFGAWFLIFTGLASLPIIVKKPKAERRRFLAILGGVIVLTLAVLSQWLYANLTFHDILSTKLDYNTYWIDSIDSYLGRFSPIPVPWKLLHRGGTEVYIDSEMNTPLLLLFIYAAKKTFSAHSTISFKNRHTPLLLVSLILMVFATILSLNYSHNDRLAQLVKFAQFHYRMTTYINLSLFAAFITLLFINPHLKLNKKFLTFCLTLSFLGCVLKTGESWQRYRYAPEIEYAGDTPYRSYDRDNSKMLKGPFNSYGYFLINKNMAGFVTEQQEAKALKIELPVLDHDQFGKVLEAEVNIKGPENQWVITNIFGFPWVNTTVDNVTIPNEKLLMAGFTSAVSVPPGKHFIGMKFNPPAVWLKLRCISFTTLTLWVFTALGWWLWVFWDRRRI